MKKSLRHKSTTTRAHTLSVLTPVTKLPQEIRPMKLRDSFLYGSLAMLIVMVSAWASQIPEPDINRPAVAKASPLTVMVYQISRVP